MSEDIKEILEDIKFCGDLSNKCDSIMMTDNECFVLLDYIANLEHENFNLRENIYIERTSLPEELTKDKNFMELYDMPSYEELLKENERLKERNLFLNSVCVGFDEKYEDYKSRNEKALELIEKEKYIAYDYDNNEYITLDEEDIFKLENILQGSDEE